jgi:hypothetical protein
LMRISTQLKRLDTPTRDTDPLVLVYKVLLMLYRK